MSETIQVAIISATLGVSISGIFQLISQLANKYLDKKLAEETNEQKRRTEYIAKKEEIYIAAIDRLLQIRRGFDYTREMTMFNKAIQEEIEKNNSSYFEVSPRLRLYATDKIFNNYQQLALFSRYAYASQNGPRLIENSKWAFDMQITILARQMQDDLGYRKYNDGYDTITCPACGKEHDMISECPNCGMSFKELQIRSQEVIEQIQEIQADDEEENDDLAQ